MAKGGKRDGAGRKSKAEEMGLQALLDGCISNRERRGVIARLLRRAKGKDHRLALEADKLLLSYLYGTPRQSIEHSGNPDKPIVHNLIRIRDVASTNT